MFPKFVKTLAPGGFARLKCASAEWLPIFTFRMLFLFSLGVEKALGSCFKGLEEQPIKLECQIAFFRTMCWLIQHARIGNKSCNDIFFEIPIGLQWRI